MNFEVWSLSNNIFYQWGATRPATVKDTSLQGNVEAVETEFNWQSNRQSIIGEVSAYWLLTNNEVRSGKWGGTTVRRRVVWVYEKQERSG